MSRFGAASSEGEAFVDGYDVIRERDKVKSSLSLALGERWVGFDYPLSIEEDLHLFGLLSGAFEI